MPHAVDLHVGAEIVRRRSLAGLNQSELGRALGVSFQQVQKYEKGLNRVSASRLSQCAEALGCTVGDFFPDANQPSPVGRATFFGLRGAAALAKAYEALSANQRRLVVAMATELVAPASAADEESLDYLEDERPEAMDDQLAGELHA